MDEQGLGRLFREAVEDPPPASFGRAEVMAASHRATARHRGVLALGTLLGVALLTGGLLSAGVLGASREPTARQAPPKVDATAAPGMPHPLGTAPGSAETTPRGGAEQAGCAPHDDALVTEVTAVLATRGNAVAGPAGDVPGPCPAGSRAAAVPVPGGTWYVLVVPQAGPLKQVDVVRPDGRREHALMLDSRRALVLISMPAVPGQPAPLGDDVPEVAEELAKRF